jgi:hypothetical protein
MSKISKVDNWLKRFIIYTVALGIFIFIGVVIIGIFSIFNGPTGN